MLRGTPTSLSVPHPSHSLLLLCHCYCFSTVTRVKRAPVYLQRGFMGTGFSLSAPGQFFLTQGSTDTAAAAGYRDQNESGQVFLSCEGWWRSQIFIWFGGLKMSLTATSVAWFMTSVRWGGEPRSRRCSHPRSTIRCSTPPLQNPGSTPGWRRMD